MAKIEQHFSIYEYQTDRGDIFQVKMQDYRASMGGFAVNGDPNRGHFGNTSNMRHVCGRSAEGFRSKLYVASPTNVLYLNGGSWADVDGTVFNVTSAIGERRLGMHQ